MSVATVRQRPTRRQLEVLRSHIATGSITAAAHELDIAESTARQHLSGLYRRTGCLNAAQAAYVLGRADTASGRPSADGPTHSSARFAGASREGPRSTSSARHHTTDGPR